MDHNLSYSDESNGQILQIEGSQSSDQKVLRHHRPILTSDVD